MLVQFCPGDDSAIHDGVVALQSGHAVVVTMVRLDFLPVSRPHVIREPLGTEKTLAKKKKLISHFAKV